ncbi:MAG: ribonuclease J [Firmicutes bacterium]|nr:ribonuclease J [Bacillota bacterium]
MSTTTRRTTKADLPLRVIFLGGVGEIGKNMTALEYGDEIIIIDCGVSFPSGDMPGVDLVIPDITYLTANRDKVKGIVLTHGHEDHIGAIPFVLKELNVPVYGTRLTLALLEPKIREHKLLEVVRFNVVRAGATVALGANFKVEFVNVSHSVAGSCALSITTPLGIVFHTGDFKVDFTPIAGNVIDLQRIAEIGQQGVMLLMSESTNVEKSGSSLSEAVVGQSLNQIFSENTDRRIFIATFASNVHRLQQIIDLAQKYNRKVAFSGRSMINVTDVAFKIGELRFPQDAVVDLDRVKDIEDKHLVIITTGSQGEPMSALTRMSKDEFNHIQMDYNDTVVISASPIPGNERHVYDVINNLYRHGVRVIYEKLADVHVSGHACQEELKLMIALLQPSFFIPVHGEFRHLKKHAELAMRMGIPAQRILLCDIGNCAEISKTKGLRLASEVTAGNVLVDGLGVGDVGSSVLKDRKHLSEDGLFLVVIGLNTERGEVTALEMLSRGFVYTKESDGTETMGAAKTMVYKLLQDFDLKGELNDWGVLKNAVRRELKSFLHKKTRRNPMILTVVIES